MSSNNVRVKLAAFTGILLALLFFGDKSWDNLLLTLTGTLAAAGGVAWWAHVGGFLFGAATFPLFLRRERRPAW